MPVSAQGVVVEGVGPVSDAVVVSFVEADRNEDGVLTFSEFQTFVRRLAGFGDSTARFIRTFGVYRPAFRRVDANRDGVATPVELHRADQGFRSDG